MIRLITAAGFVVAVATSAQAITPAPIPSRTAWSRKFASDAAQVGHWSLATAWPEPPSVIPAESSAGAIERNWCLIAQAPSADRRRADGLRLQSTGRHSEMIRYLSAFARQSGHAEGVGSVSI